MYIRVDEIIIIYTKFGMRYLKIKKPPNVTMIEINGSIIKNNFSGPFIIEFLLKINPIDRKIKTNITICWCAWEIRSTNSFACLGSQSSSFPIYRSIVPDGLIDVVAATYMIPVATPIPKTIRYATVRNRRLLFNWLSLFFINVLFHYIGQQ